MSFSLSVLHHQNSTTYPSISNQLTLQELCHTILGKNLPPQTHFKLIIKGRPTAILSPGPQDSSTLQSLGFTQTSHKILLVTSLHKDIQKTEEIENEKQKRIKARLETKPVKIWSRLEPDLNPYKIYDIEILSDTHEFEIERKDLLERLCIDRSVQKVMKEFQFKVMKLGELHPIRDSKVLGVNENFGEVIKLRLLTDRLDGLRSFKMIRRVLCHELAHIRFGAHLNDFKEFDSLINRMMLNHDRLILASSYRLGGELGDHWKPEEELDHHCSVVSNSSSSSNTVHQLVELHQDKPADPKQAAAEAALRRATRKSS
ncbi:hypothetical protein CROQUDRAFT_661083 [Cronartium quercuum f. sp. fusiforme G11]|uniref:WLM domain-containing protein n=1 Tax=Cronartium quercuum f. sp. fusiforme G11 TaxID=708437 RepID=A0A9P6T901_9BASI|nr:hypothetical protein CROQUDRAFT_661083 [Cronartium quercuum f. sp. fusiforme G11]